MLVTRPSPVTGKEHTMDLPITVQQLYEWSSGAKLIQDAMPHLTPDQREFLMTGCTSEDWDNMWSEDKQIKDAIGMEGEDTSL